MVNISEFHATAASQDLVEAAPIDKETLPGTNQFVDALGTTNIVPSKRKEMTSTAPNIPTKSTVSEHRKKKRADIIHPSTQEPQGDPPSAQETQVNKLTIVPDLTVVQRFADSLQIDTTGLDEQVF